MFAKLIDQLKIAYKTPQFWIAAAAFIIPTIYYAILIPKQFTFGDGPELLTAMHTLGGPHPSGYPLFTMLGYIPAHLGIISPWWNVSFALGAIPTALGGLAIYKTLREVETTNLIALLGALAWCGNTHVVYQATRVEVYALHCMLIAYALWFCALLLRTKDIRWGFAATLATSLALTNHLTSVFLIVPVVLAMFLANRRELLKPKSIAILLGIGAVCSAIYLYLPWQAAANTGDRISWNNTQTFERFWFHVSGKEYSVFRRYDKIVPTLTKFITSLESTFFPGFAAFVVLGAYEWATRRWRFLLIVVLFQITSLGYLSTYPIKDIATYYTGLYIGMAIAFTIGVDWFVRARFPTEGSARLRKVGGALVFTVALAWLIGLYYNGSRNAYKEAVAEGMSASTIADMQEPALIFSSVDGHSFPMWYQKFVNHPDKKFAPVDTIMFRLDNKKWYRDYFRTHYTWMKWPDEKTVKSGKWREWLIENNPDVNFYALLSKRWKHKGSYPINRGWHFKIERGEVPPSQRSVYAKHVYVAEYKKFRSSVYFRNPTNTFKLGEDKIPCVAEWVKHEGLTADWIFKGPDDKIVRFKPHGIPKGSNQSWEFLEIKDQVPGTWSCEVIRKGEMKLVVPFTITP